MNELLEAAKKYANMGLAVFPLRVKGKEPITENGFKDATTDIRIIAEIWLTGTDAYRRFQRSFRAVSFFLFPFVIVGGLAAALGLVFI